MFICRRILQLGALSALLAGCSTTAPTAAPSPSLASQTAQASGTTPIRIGPSAPPPGPELADDAPATLTPSGALRPEVRSFVEDLAAERQLPLAPMVSALESSRYNATVARLIAPSPPGKKIWRKGGCDACHHEGYRGRAGLYEVVAVDDRLQAMIHNGVAEAELERAARVDNPALLDDGVAKVRAGVTTVEEVARVVRDEG